MKIIFAGTPDFAAAALNAIAPAAARYHIPHPMRLAGNPQLKRSAWETLQKLQSALK